jgi:2-polyprenyl-3-methyl-5-hydroxy-6-metoxy-1,4-benzoquinol methylase
MADSALLAELKQLYGRHYGTWGSGGIRPGRSVQLSDEMMRQWLGSDSILVWAEAFGEKIGYAIAVHAKMPGHGLVSWVTQLVVHRDHRKQDVGKTILFTVWRFSNCFAWGILSANPFAVRALEKATRRRCQPVRIQQFAPALRDLGIGRVPYVNSSTELIASGETSRINTRFFLDHSDLPTMLDSDRNSGKEWLLGDLLDGWEWFAFTFHDQKQIGLSEKELSEMLRASDRVTKLAFSRMHPQKKNQGWARHTAQEAEFLTDILELRPGATLLDFGCGDGRHALELAKLKITVMGIDYTSRSIDDARAAVDGSIEPYISFRVADCRDLSVPERFDAGICLYDVIGTYVEDHNNQAILDNLAKHVKPGGPILLSVMNRELTERIAKHWFSIATDPDKLLELPASRTMEQSGEIFNPDYYLIEKDTRTIYRKEQFGEGEELFDELLVRDRRYTEEEIRHLCITAGLEVIWTRFVRAGKWNSPVPPESEHAKEILVFCRNREPVQVQQVFWSCKRPVFPTGMECLLSRRCAHGGA